MSTVYELARAVEEVTGLEGYDPQLGEPVSDTRAAHSAAAPRQEDDDDEDDAERGSRRVPARPGGPRDRDRRPADGMPGGRWWEFWKT